MRISKYVSGALLAIASLLVGGISSPAATVPDPVSGELYLGFRASGGIGGSTSYLVKIGLDTSFSTTPGTTFTLSLGNLGLDLAAVYGEDWFTRADLFWGVFGTRSSASPIVYGSKERTDPGVQSQPWITLDLTARSAVDSQISSVLNSIGGYRGREATENSPFATFQPNSSSASSYNFQVATPGTTDFGSLSQWGSIEGSFASGTDGSVLDLYRIAGSGVTYRGSFSIDDAGLVTYSVVPEPSVAALLVVAGAAVAGIRRRRPAADA